MMKTKIVWLLLAVVAMELASCGSNGGRFRLEGRLRNMNQGEFWVYSPDGGIEGIDTIPVREGRFAYEADLNNPATFVVIFPNYSEQPVFARPGAKVEVKGDASHLKEMTIGGTDDNKLMTQLRMELNRLTPPDVPKTVSTFIKEHPQSPVSIYVLRRFFVLDPQPDYKQALTLTKLLLKEQPDNGQLLALKKQLEGLQKGAVKTQLGKFTATDVKGRKVTEKNLKAKVNVVTAWASWNYQSTDMQRRLKQLQTKYGDKLAVLSICLDGRVDDCKKTVIERDSLKWPTVCDGRMWQTPLLRQFGFATIPANLIADQQGRITHRNLTPMKLDEQIDQLLRDK